MRSRLVILLVCLSLTPACGVTGSFSDASTSSVASTIASATSTTTSTTSTPLAPLRAGPVADWDGANVGSVCVEVSQSFPQVPDYDYDLLPALEDLLGGVGIAMGAPGEVCDAHLAVTMSLEGRPAEYTGAGTIYSGMLRTLDMTLSAEGREPLEYHSLTDQQPGELASASGPKTPEEFLERWEEVWPTIVLDGLIQFWGLPVVVEAVRSEDYGLDAHAKLCRLSGSAPGECPPFAYEAWRAWFDEIGGVQPLPAGTDPMPTALESGVVTCDGCPVVAGIPDAAPDVGSSTTLTLAGAVTGAEGAGVFFVDGGTGHHVGGPIPLDADGSFRVTVPLFCGEQTVKLAWRNDSGISGVVLRPTGSACSAAALLVTLTWDGLGDDFELHLIREGGRINDRTDDGSGSNDCTWNTCIHRSPDWGVAGSTDDDPVKDIDDTGGFGPENIRLGRPEQMTYTVMVEHWGPGSPEADGEVTINVESGRVVTVPIRDLPTHWVVVVATIEFPSGVITPVGEQYDCSGEWGFNGGCGAALPG